MATITIASSSLKGSLRIPSSKSQTLRAILFASFADGASVLTRPLMSSDTEKMIEACVRFGAKIQIEGERLMIEGNGGVFPGREIVCDVGNSGIALRFLAGMAALGSSPVTLTGDASLCRRPMTVLGEALKDLGAEVSYRGVEGFAPLTVRGPFRKSAVKLPGHDSQPVSALLIASSLLGRDMTIEVVECGERPWIDMTLHWLKARGVQVAQKGGTFHVFGKGWSSFDYTVPGDWSTAAFPIGAALVTGSKLCLEGLADDPCQGDRKIISILESMGAKFQKAEVLKVLPSRQLHGIALDVNDCIDTLPILAVLGCYAKGTTKLYNAAVAKTKECDRIACLAEELGKMEAHIRSFDDGLLVEGGQLRGAVVDSHGDHRLAMALAVAALGADGPATIRGVECIAKTYPDFTREMARLGARL